MKRFTILVLSIVLAGGALRAQSSYRFEAEAAGGVLHLPGIDRTGWAARQQLTAYLRPRIGLSLGLSWGGSANTAPLSVSSGPFGRPDPARLDRFYVRAERLFDLSAVLLPVLTRRHQLAVRAGVSAYRSQASRVDSVVYYGPDRRDYGAVLQQSSLDRVVPVAGISYDYRLSGRWAVGLTGSAYFTGERRPATLVGLRTTYRFNIGTDSLGLPSISRADWRMGVRLAANLTASNGRSEASVYRLRGVGGLWAELPLSLIWQMRGEINYAQRGSQVRGQQMGNVRYLSAMANLNYLEVPLLFRNEVGYHWHLYGGPYLAFLLNGRASSDGLPVAVTPHTISGLIVGADYQLTDQLAVDLRYQRDLVRLSSTPYGGLHGFQLGVSWAIARER
ncbi:porin family protein [Spirosoma sp. 209]|uniref:porin family protein n=1 Tax=Spirosoma sp. 209 TaxID=1955701 RepID=UPI00137476EE|nr:porin family protein [Spirosoma sp. 209]